MDAFIEISLIILLATGVSFILKSLKQPLIVGYILTGVLVGPYVFNLQQSKDGTEFLAKVGVTILLFIVGLNLSPKVIHDIGKSSILGGVGQVLVTAVAGYGLCRLIGLSSVSSLYICLALTFSSTIIILKLLTDRGDAQALYGKITVGLLLFQDLVASVVLIIVSSTAVAPGSSLWWIGLTLTIKGLLMVGLLIVLNKKALPLMLGYIASAQELLFLFSIAWGLIVASAFYRLGLSMEIGALAAGVVLSTTPFATEIASRLKPLRDFFVLLFFVMLGSQMTLGIIPQIIVPATLLALFVLIGKPIIVYVLMNQLGYRRKTSFKTGLMIAQISEFSLLLTTLGATIGHLPKEVVSLITLVGLITISGSTYLVLYSEQLYKKLEKLLRVLEWRNVSGEKMIDGKNVYEVILFGYHRVGADFVKAIQKLQKPYVVVDYDPAAIRRLTTEGIPHLYGDADDTELLEDAGINNAKLIVSTIPDFEVNKLLVEKLALANSGAVSIVISHNVNEALDLYKLGAGYIIMPVYLGAQYATRLIGKYGLNARGFAEERKRHLDHLQKRKNEA